MTMSTPTPWQDDTDPLKGLKWADEDVPEPGCTWCNNTGWRWTLGPNHRAEYLRCDRCFEGSDHE